MAYVFSHLWTLTAPVVREKNSMNTMPTFFSVFDGQKSDHMGLEQNDDE